MIRAAGVGALWKCSFNEILVLRTRGSQPFVHGALMTTNQKRLSVAEARAIIGLPEVEGAPPNLPDLSRLDQNWASPSCDMSVPSSIREYGGTLKSRFAAIARRHCAERKDTRGHSRSLVGRRANLQASIENGGAAGRVSGVGKALSLPIQRW